jgi:hypothetical protein
MIAFTMYNCLTSKAVKKFITPDIRPLRALFFIFSDSRPADLCPDQPC